jgi:YVTN family beta-propeller protein
VEFRLLGLLEVTGDDGRTVEIVRGHESGLLALLLLHANEALSPERIVEELWSGSPPENARKSVHIYVSRLRKALGPERIETTRAGYLLRVAPDELDVSHFVSLATEGREALDRGSPEEAESVFDRALALWRVAPLADFRFEAFAQAETRRLEELHGSVVADRVDARIARGRPHLVLDELDGLIERSPLWERPRAQLMRALYLTGRQADALELYRQTRTLLDEELGVDPGPELQRLERQILNHDPELGEPTSPPRPRVRQRRFQLSVALTVAVVVAAFGANALSRGATPSATRPNVTNPAEAVSAIDPRTNRVVSTTPVGRYPNRMASDRNALWVINAQDETISRIDPRTHVVVHTFAPGSVVTDLTVFANALWVAAPLDNRVLRLDESTDEVSARIAAPNPLLVASGSGKLWVGGLKLLTVDPVKGTGTVVFDPHIPDARPSADADPGALVVLGRRLFFDEAGQHVQRVDPATHAATQSRQLRRFGWTTRMIAVNGSLWLTSAEGGDLIRIDPLGLESTMKVRVGSRPVGVAYGAGSLWVANSGDGTVMRIDPSDGRILATIHVGGTPYELAFTHGLAWVTIL